MVCFPAPRTQVPFPNHGGIVACSSKVVCNSDLLDRHAADRRRQEYAVDEVERVAQVGVDTSADGQATSEHRGAAGAANRRCGREKKLHQVSFRAPIAHGATRRTHAVELGQLQAFGCHLVNVGGGDGGCTPRADIVDTNIIRNDDLE